MSLLRTEVGLVSNGSALADFYERVLGLEVLEPVSFPIATIHRLGLGGVPLLKIMVPTASPSAPASTNQFWDVAGLRYLTAWVDDLDATLARCTAEGGRIATPAATLRPGVRAAVIADPDGNAVEVMEASA